MPSFAYMAAVNRRVPASGRTYLAKMPTYRGRLSAKRTRVVGIVKAAARNRAPRIKGAIAPFGGQRELKYVDTANADYACDTTGSVTALNLLAVGDDNTTRDGRQATMKSVQLHGALFPVDTVTASAKCRVILVWDNAVNSGAIATIAQILTSANGNAFPLIDNSNRFTILVDRTYTLGRVQDTATQAFASSPNTFDVEIYKKLNNVTQYSGTTAAIGSIQNGGLLLVTVGNQAAGAGGNLNASVRVRFTDQ